MTGFPSTAVLRACWRRLACLSACFLLAACVAAPIAPANAPRALPPLPPEPSVISLPVRIDLGQLGTVMLKRLPRPLLASASMQHLTVRYNALRTSLSMESGSCSVTALDCGGTRRAVETRVADYMAPTEARVLQEMTVRGLDITMSGNQLTLAAEVEFALEAQLPAGATPVGSTRCDEEGGRPRFEMMLGGTVDWDAQGQVTLLPRPSYIRLLRACGATAWQTPPEGMLDLAGLGQRLQRALHEVVLERLQQASLRAQLARAWVGLNTPREIRPGVWLLMRPGRLAFAGLEGKGRQVSTALLVQAWPELVRGARPVLPVPPMPAPEPGPLEADGLHLSMRGALPLREAGVLLSRRLASETLQVEGESVQVRRARLFGHGDKAVLALSMSLPPLAEVYLMGRPVLDLQRNEIRLEDLEFSPESRDYLRRTAQGLLSREFLESIRRRAAFPFDATLVGALQELRDLRLDAGDDLLLRGGLQHLQPRGLYFTRDSLVAYVELEGRMALEERQAQGP